MEVFLLNFFNYKLSEKNVGGDRQKRLIDDDRDGYGSNPDLVILMYALGKTYCYVCSLLTLCLLVCVFNFLVFKYGARCVLFFT